MLFLSSWSGVDVQVVAGCICGRCSLVARFAELAAGGVSCCLCTIADVSTVVRPPGELGDCCGVVVRVGVRSSGLDSSSVSAV